MSEHDQVQTRAANEERERVRDIYRTLDLSLRIGEQLLSSGAGAADVAAQMHNVAHAGGLRGFNADVMFTEVSMSHQPRRDEPAIQQARQVRYRTTDYEHLTMVDHLIRDLTEGRITRDQASARLARIVSSGHARARWTITTAYGVMNLGVALMLRGTWLVCLIAFVAAFAIDLMQRRMASSRLPLFYQQVAGGLLATLLAVLVAAAGAELDPGRVITATIILLLAGVNFMGAIQDALTGYPLTAGARSLEAVLATTGVIAGVSGGIAVAGMLGVSLGRTDPGAPTFSDLTFLTLGGAVVAAAFAFASYAPLRSLAPIGLIGGSASALYGGIYYSQLGIVWASGLAAFFVGLVAFALAGRVRVPALVVIVSGVVPLLPGLSIYRGLSMLAEGDNAGILAMVNAFAITIALASGVYLGEFVAQPLKKEARRVESRLSGPRMVGPHRATTHLGSRRRAAQQRTERAREVAVAAHPASQHVVVPEEHLPVAGSASAGPGFVP